MRVVKQFPRTVREIEHCWIPMNDGCRLAARIWLPAEAGHDPVPGILEYLPYRKRDGTARRDELTHPYFAGHGYACVRVDMRGNGDSDGLMHDEYLVQEQDDALQVIDWITEQAWCSGQVGMMGISWGGFNALQVAARQPPALRAIVTVCSTDDRYEDDIHYKGGCLLNENLGWAATMMAFSSRPPDPALVGAAWRATWMQRLRHLPLLVETWLRHQRRDGFWKHGSVCEDFSRIKAAVLAVGGWGDAYSNAVPRLLVGLSAPVRGLVGPWIHKYPHLATPEPAIGFLQECLRWWDQWLKGAETGIMAEPAYRAYLMDHAPPRPDQPRQPGRWIAEQAWPLPGLHGAAFRFGPNGALSREAATGAAVLRHCSAQDTGLCSGEYCAMWAGPESPGEQRDDDAASLCFDTAALRQRLEVFGAAMVSLRLSVDRPRAFVAVRLCDVAPGGSSARVTYGILNLTHRNGHERPMPLQPGKRYDVRVRLDDVAYGFAPGHRIRLAVSTSYWPLLWPSPEPATITLFTEGCSLELPERMSRPEALHAFEGPEGSEPISQQVLRAPASERVAERGLAGGESILRMLDDFGAYRIRSHGLEHGAVAREAYRIRADDPLSARAECHWTTTLGRDAWQVRSESRSRQWADAENFFIEAEIRAFEGSEQVFERRWHRTVPRDMV